MTDFQPTYSNSYALIMGVNAYQHMPPLEAAVRGAQNLTQVLADQYGFEVTTLTDEQVTRDAVFRWINHIRRSTGPDDRVLIYFAGHGLTRGMGPSERGYLGLAESQPDEWQTTLAMDDVVEEAAYIPAKHLLYMLDCCFGGLALDLRAVPEVPRALDYYLTRPVRYAISAGGREVVDDSLAPDNQHSLFTYHLLEWLSSDRFAPADGIWRARELGNYLEAAVARSRKSGHKPNHNYLPGSGDGDFLFKWEVGPRLPVDLQIALRSSDANLRRGAVAALISLARSDDDAATPAHEHLTTLSVDDPDEQVRRTAASFFDEQAARQAAHQAEIGESELRRRVETARQVQAEAEEILKATREYKLIKMLDKTPLDALPAGPPSQPVSDRPSPRRPWPVMVGGGLVLLVIVLGGLMLTGVIGSSNQPESTADSSQLPYTDGDILLEEDFEDGFAQGWDFDPASWQIREDADGNLVWHARGNIAATAGSMLWQNYAIEFRARGISPSPETGAWEIAVTSRTDPADINCPIVSATLGDGREDQRSFGVVSLDFPQAACTMTLSDMGQPIEELDRWYDFRLETYGTTARLLRDGRVIASTVIVLERPGKLTLRIHRDSTAYFDDVRVIELLAADSN